jgi:tRNA threonylcarbamoyladenosine biosynthesis protein TsaB
MAAVPDAPSIILAIESSQRAASVAVNDRHGNVHMESLQTGRRHDDDLLPAINRLFQTHQLTPSDLTGLGVSIGPGGFTGLRVAISTVKMLSLRLQIPIAAVPSALVAAQTTRPTADRIIIALASKGESAWITHLQHTATRGWEIIGQPALANARDLSLDKVELMLADEHLPRAIRDRCEAQGVAIAPPHADAVGCHVIARAMLDAGQTCDADTLVPLYPRQPEAVTLWQQRQQADQ